MVRALLAVAFVASVVEAKEISIALSNANLQPIVVANTLVKLENEWAKQAVKYIECEISESKEDAIRDCDEAPSPFMRSCRSTVTSIVQGSDGNAKVMKEYMSNVCNQAVMTKGSWHQSICVSLANGIGMKMSASNYDNRESFETHDVCDAFWTNFLEDQKTRHQKELVDIHKKENEAAKASMKLEKAAQEKSEHERKMKEEADEAEDTKEAEAIEAEKKRVALRANAQGKLDGKTIQQEAEVEALSMAAKKKLEEAAAVEKDVKEGDALKAGKKQLERLRRHTDKKPVKKPAYQYVDSKKSVRKPWWHENEKSRFMKK